MSWKNTNSLRSPSQRIWSAEQQEVWCRQGTDKKNSFHHHFFFFKFSYLTLFTIEIYKYKKKVISDVLTARGTLCREAGEHKDIWLLRICLWMSFIHCVASKRGKKASICPDMRLELCNSRVWSDETLPFLLFTRARAGWVRGSWCVPSGVKAHRYRSRGEGGVMTEGRLSDHHDVGTFWFWYMDAFSFKRARHRWQLQLPECESHQQKLINTTQYIMYCVF